MVQYASFTIFFNWFVTLTASIVCRSWTKHLTNEEKVIADAIAKSFPKQIKKWSALN